MKLVTAIAITALLAGVSVANAQSSTSGGTTSSGMTTGSSPYCSKDQAGKIECKFASMDACEKAKSSSDECIPNASTTGSGASGSSMSPTSPSSPSSPSNGMKK